MSSIDDITNGAARHSALIHRENLQLGILLVVAVAAFVATRAVAANNRDVNLRDAAEWYRRGEQQVASKQLDEAIDSFRRATVRDRGNRRYAIALAGALTLARDDDAARAALMSLRESAPEDTDVNLQLARLAAERQDVTEAMRYYRNTLYAPWPAEQSDVRRQVRFEFIRFLLAHDQGGRAQAELLALTNDLSDDAEPHLEAAKLFAGAADSAHALEQFERVLALDPDNAEALTGAGKAAFRLRDYPRARRYLHQTPDQTEEVATTRAIVDLILSGDPLAGRIGSAERRQRFVAALTYAQERLSRCIEMHTTGQPIDPDGSLTRDLGAATARAMSARSVEIENLEAGLDVVERIEQQVIDGCPPATPFDQALALIGRQHGAEPR